MAWHHIPDIMADITYDIMISYIYRRYHHIPPISSRKLPHRIPCNKKEWQRDSSTKAWIQNEFPENWLNFSGAPPTRAYAPYLNVSFRNTYLMKYDWFVTIYNSKPNAGQHQNRHYDLIQPFDRRYLYLHPLLLSCHTRGGKCCQHQQLKSFYSIMWLQ